MKGIPKKGIERRFPNKRSKEALFIFQETSIRRVAKLQSSRSVDNLEMRHCTNPVGTWWMAPRTDELQGAVWWGALRFIVIWLGKR